MSNPEYNELMKRLEELEKTEKDRKQIENELQENEKKYRLLAENVTDIIWTMDMNLKFTYLSSSVTRLGGYSVEEAMKLPLKKMLTRNSYNVVMNTFLKELAIEKVTNKDINRSRTLELEFIHKNGSRIWGEVTMTFLRDQKNKAVGILGVARDITERKKTEDSLKKSERQYRTTIDSMADVVHVIDEKRNIIVYNTAFKAWCSKMKPDMKVENQNLFQLFPFLSERVKNEYEQVFKSGKVLTSEDNVFIDDKEYIAETRKVPVIEGGKVTQVVTIIRDVTALKKTLAVLQESEQKYRHLITYSNDAIYLLYDRKFEFINDKFQEMFGVSLEDVNKPEFDFINLVAPKSRQMVEERDRKLAAGKKLKPIRYEFTALDKEGTEIEVEVSVSYVKYKDGYATQGILRDITDRKKADHMLRMTQFSVDHAADSIFWMGPDAKFIYVNNAACKSLGYSRNELLKMTVHDIDPLFPEEVWAKHWEEIKEKKSFTIESLHKKKNGKILNVEISINYLEFEGNEYNFAFAKDISERKKSEEALTESETRYRTLFNHLADPVVIFDQENHTFLDCNESAVRKYGYTYKEWMTMKPMDLHPPDEVDKVKKNIDDIEDFSPHHYTHVTKSGYRFPVEILTQEIEYKGRPAWISIIRDITDRLKAEEERKILEEQLFQSQKMESIGRLAGGIAHDFNNILAAIMGFAEVLSMKYNDSTTGDGKAVDVILRSAKRAGDLTNQLLGFARGGKYNPEPLEINEIILDTIKMAEKIFEKNITVEYDFESDLFLIEGDRNQIEQVLTNIIINARDAMPMGGKINFKTEDIFIDTEAIKNYPELKPGNYVKILITDTGMGMPKSVKYHIFEPFFTTKEKEKGTGLGLATVYGIIKNHNGHIDCQSELGKGTTFSIVLPATDRKFIPEEEKDVVTGFQKGDATILVVDDETDLRDMLKEQLQTMGYKVFTAGDGLEAVAVYSENKDEIDLVLMDMIMPNMDGKEAFYKLKEINSEVMVLIISGFSKDEKANEILKNGAFGFIKKPFELEELSKIIYELLKKKSLR